MKAAKSQSEGRRARGETEQRQAGGLQPAPPSRHRRAREHGPARRAKRDVARLLTIAQAAQHRSWRKSARYERRREQRKPKTRENAGPKRLTDEEAVPPRRPRAAAEDAGRRSPGAGGPPSRIRWTTFPGRNAAAFSSRASPHEAGPQQTHRGARRRAREARAAKAVPRRKRRAARRPSTTSRHRHPGRPSTRPNAAKIRQGIVVSDKTTRRSPSRSTSPAVTRSTRRSSATRTRSTCTTSATRPARATWSASSRPASSPRPSTGASSKSSRRPGSR